jgi:hypothetical protein
MTCLAALLTGGCGFMVQQMVGRSDSNNRAPHPLAHGDGRLTAHADARDHMVRTYARPDTCGRTVGDDYEVLVQLDEICVTVARASDGKPRGGAWKLGLVSDGRKVEIPMRPLDEGQWLGDCVDSQATVKLWTRSSTGCIANDGIVTGASTRLTVDGDVHWAFEPG